MKVCNILWFFLFAVLCTNAQAKRYSELEDILHQSKNYLQKEVYKKLPYEDHRSVKITSSPLDGRLKLHDCANSLAFFHRTSSALKGTVSIKVSCNKPHAWSIYTKHNISLEKPIAVASKNLPIGHILSPQDIHFTQRDIYKERAGFSNNKAVLIGQQVKRPIFKDKVIYQNQLTAATVIRKGDVVNVVASIGGLSVITSGIALSNGRIGEQIDVKNKYSSRVIRAEITGKNAVKVIM